jgi:phosphoribosyl 1,2-cyclic phosphodiesterase
MEISVIASGSNGNCCLVEENGVSLLIDAGKSGREIEARLNRLGKSLENIHAIILTHAHSDHVRGAGVIARRYNIPIYIMQKTHSDCSGVIGQAQTHYFSRYHPFKVNDLRIQPVPTCHDVDSCGFVINRFGLFTDTGIVTKQMSEVMPHLRGVLLESNHDIDMLISGPYPHYLKKWILSDKGHLSNIHASQLVEDRGKELSLVLLGHLSAVNNTPERAEITFERLVRRKIEYAICSRERETGCFDL